VMKNDFYSVSAKEYRENPEEAERIEELAHEARAGNKQALKKLTEILGSIAVAVAAKQSMTAPSRGLTVEDLRQEAMVGMLKGLWEWNPEKSSYRTYAFNMARWYVLNVVNEGHLVSIPRHYAQAYEDKGKMMQQLLPNSQQAARDATTTHLSLDYKPSYRDDEERPNWEGFQVETGFHEVTNTVAIMQIFKRANLSHKEKFALLGKYKIAGVTLTKVAERFGISNTAASNWAKKGERKLQMAQMYRGEQAS
jgi:RNA polymerase sigma factor (sigma-70 family)